MTQTLTAATDTKHVALMLRISRDKGENEDTLQNHRETLAEYAANNGLTYDTYAEIISGGITEIEDRPELRRMIDNIEKYQAILCISLDRLARNGVVSQQIKQLCIDYNIEIITPAQIFDLSNNQQDRLLYDISSTFAVLEYETIAKRNKLNKISRSKRGEHVAGSVPFGYVRNKETKRLEIDEEAAETIRYIFKLHSQGLGSFKVRDILNAEGYKSAKGGVFNLPAIKRIIKNPVYKGTIVFNDRKKVKEGGKYIYKTNAKYTCDDAHPAIISKEEWNKANGIRKARAEHAAMIREKPVIKTETTMLKDLLFCGKCGRKLTIRKDNKLDYYTVKVCEYLLPNSSEKCHNAGIMLNHVEDLFKANIVLYKEQVSEQTAQLLANNTGSVERTIMANIAHIVKQLEETKRENENFTRLAKKGFYTDEELLSEKQTLTSRLASLYAELEAAKAKLKEIDVRVEIERLKDIQKLLKNFDELDAVTQNEYLKTFVKAVYYRRDMPKHIKELSTRNPERRNFPFTLEVEYI